MTLLQCRLGTDEVESKTTDRLCSAMLRHRKQTRTYSKTVTERVIAQLRGAVEFENYVLV